MDKYESLSDDELILLVRDGDESAQYYLLTKYKDLVRIKARSYFMIGADREDIIQEGMIGLYKAVRDFVPEKNISFFNFARLCVTRQIITAIKTAARKKHMPLNSSVSLNSAIDEENGGNTYINIVSAHLAQSPEELLIDRENKSFIENRIEEVLSVMECRVLQLFLKGKSYAEIARIINKDEKSIDNSLQRVRRKLDKILSEADMEGVSLRS